MPLLYKTRDGRLIVRCARCAKPLEAFHFPADRWSKTGLSEVCLTCHRDRTGGDQHLLSLKRKARRFLKRVGVDNWVDWIFMLRTAAQMAENNFANNGDGPRRGTPPYERLEVRGKRSESDGDRWDADLPSRPKNRRLRHVRPGSQDQGRQHVKEG